MEGSLRGQASVVLGAEGGLGVSEGSWVSMMACSRTRIGIQ